MGFFDRLFRSETLRLKGELRLAEEKIGVQSQELESIAQRFNTLQLSSNAELDRLNGLLQSALSEQADLAAELRRQSNQLAKKRSNLVKANEHSQSLEEALKESTTRCTGLERANERVSAQVAELNRSISRKDAQITSLTADLDGLKSAEARTSRAIVSSAEKVRSLTAQLKEANLRISDLSDELAESNENLVRMSLKLDLYAAEAAVLREQAVTAAPPWPKRQYLNDVPKVQEPPAIDVAPSQMFEEGEADSPPQVVEAWLKPGSKSDNLRLATSEDGAPEGIDEQYWPVGPSLGDDDPIRFPGVVDVASLVDSIPEELGDLDDADDWAEDVAEPGARQVSQFNRETSLEYIESILNEEDAFSDDIGPTRDELNTERSSRLTRAGRASQVASDLVERYALPDAALPVLKFIFIDNWWESSKTAVKSLLDRGASYQEILLAFEIRKFWASNSQFSTYFLESDEPSFRQSTMPWLVALEFVRAFRGLPDIEELEQYLNESVEFWLSRRSLHYSYPSYLLYFKGIIDSRLEGELIASPRSAGRLPP